MCFPRLSSLLFAASLLTSGLIAQTLSPASAQPQDRVTAPVSDSQTVSMNGNVNPLATGLVQTAAADVSMERMILSLKPDAGQNSLLEQLIAQQQDPKSPLYHVYLSPKDFGTHFGVSQGDISKVTRWLTAHGFTIDEIPEGHRSIVFSGTAAQVEMTFNTQIKKLSAGGITHYANGTDPRVPASLAAVVGGIVKLHNYKHQPSLGNDETIIKTPLTQAQFTASNGAHYLSPADYSTIYNLKSLYSAGIDGTGQSIAVIARSNISVADVQAFRQTFGLPANDPTLMIVNSNPGILSGDSTETMLDTQWAGAIAPKAAIKVIIAASTNTADGIDLASQYAVNKNVAPVITVSYGSCEQYMGSSEMSFYNALWQQAAAQGQTVLVSSGDSGVAGCNGGSSTSASIKGVNGLCSSPYSTCVGGTQFNEGSNPGQYWFPGNNAIYGSAISYIPETVWNESTLNGGSGLWASGGGSSIYFAKPAWQTGAGVPADGRRDVPDISLSAAGHDGYIIVQGGGMYAMGGTSASAPSFAGLMALVNQKTGNRQGNANTTLYQLAASSSANVIFHDIVTGNNSVTGVAGYQATPGYDLATGLGTVDGTQMVNHWADAKNTSPGVTLTATSTSVTLKTGATLQTTITSAVSSSFKSAVSLAVSGAPTGLTTTLGAATIASPGSGSVALTLTAATNVVPGTYSIKVTGQGGSQTASVTISVVVPAPTFTVSSNASVPAYVGDTAVLPVTLTPQNGFNSSVALTLRGLPAGVTAAFASPAITSNNIATTNLTFTLAKTAAAGSYPLIITGTGGGVTQTTNVILVVTVRASCTLVANPNSVKLNAGQSGSVQVVCGAVQGSFSTALTFAVSGQPAGVTAAFNSASVAAGAGATLNIATTTAARTGTYTLAITASTTAFTQTIALPVTLAVPSTFTLAAGSGAVTSKPGSSGQFSFTLVHVGAFNSAISLTLAGVPAGVTATLSRTSVPAPGDGSVSINVMLSSAAKPGTYPLTLTASGGGVTQTASASLTIASPADFAFTISTNALTVQQGGAAANLTVSTGNFTGGFNSTITITYTNLAPGMNWKYISGTAANNMVNNTVGFFVPASTPAGVYPITVTASGAGIVHSATVNITVVQANTQVKK